MNDGAIAIVGASCRFPGAPGLDAFWQLLVDGIDAVSEIGPERWATRFFHHQTPNKPGKTYSWAAGLIDGIDLFDPGFFGISPREAAEIDPQQRILLELAWHALEDAGIPSLRLAGSETGVYIGASSSDYGDLRVADPAGADRYFATGVSLGILANRISHVFDLRGPSEVIDTACSASLVALHQACEALRGDHIEVALVGGINLLLSPYPFIGFAQAGMLSRRGRCYAFDARADGYVRGEGGGVVVLKRLERALTDGDAIRAVINATAVSSSGRTIGLSLPSETAQIDLLRRVYRDAGIAPDRLAFVEMHGTGTPAGDPVEAAAVGTVLGQTRAEKLPIGSAKTNIGHLEPASGMAGLLKAMLALEHGVLPRSLHGETPNPNIPFNRLNLRLVQEAERIQPDRYAGINSFGFGGMNAHAVLSAVPRQAKPEAVEGASPPLLISAGSHDSLRLLAVEWRTKLSDTPSARTPALLRAAARHRDHHPCRLAVIDDDCLRALEDYLNDRTNPKAIAGTTASGGKLAFVYSGNGAQFPGMGRAAYEASPAFRAAIAESDRALQPHLGWSVAERIADGLTADEIRRTDIAQPALFAIQVAITTVLRDFGAGPEGFTGHSVGEIAAAWAAGALSLGEAARVVAVRSRHQQTTCGTGRMAVLGQGPLETERLLSKWSGRLEIAAINSRRSVTIAGDEDLLVELGVEAASQGLMWRPLDLDFAFHSAGMEPIRDGLLADLADVSFARPTGDFIASVSGKRAGALDAMHWWRNVREPVHFSAALDTMIADRYRTFVEIGPDPVLLPYLREALRDEVTGRVVATFDRRTVTGDPFPAIAARLYVAGCDMSHASWFDGPGDPHGLPLYPWQRERCWFTRTVESAGLVDPVCDRGLLGFRQTGPVSHWVNHIDVTSFPFLADHRVGGAVVFPAALFVDMALAAAHTRVPDAEALELHDVELLRPMTFDDTGTREVRCELTPSGDWQIAGRQRLVDEPLTLHATARVATVTPGRLSMAGELRGERRSVSSEELYRRATRLGLDYGPSFRTVDEVMVSADRASLALKPMTQIVPDCLIDPTLLDGALQGLLALRRGEETEETAYLPRRFGQIKIIAPFGRTPCRAELHLKRIGSRSAMADITLYDAAGSVVAELVDAGFVRVELHASSARHLLHVDLVPAPLGSVAPPDVLDQLPEILPRIAAQGRDLASQEEQALLLDALLTSIAVEAVERGWVGRLPEPLIELVRRVGSDDLPHAGDLWRRMLADHPSMVSELTFAAELKEALSQGKPSLDGTVGSSVMLREASPAVLAAKTVIEATLDEIAAQWPRDRPLRVREHGATRVFDRLHRFGLSVRRVDDGEPGDITICTEAGAIDTSWLREGLSPGGVFLAVMPLSSAFWDVFGGQLPDWREELAASGFVDIGSTPAALGPWPCEVIWARMRNGLKAPRQSEALSLVVIADGVDPAFTNGLEAAGHCAVASEIGDGDAVLMAFGSDGDPAAEAGRLLPSIARAAVLAAERQIPLWLVTSGATQPCTNDSPLDASLWGFGRVLRNEIAGLTLRLVDLPAEMPWTRRAEIVAQELVAASAESEIAWTAAGRHVLRVRRGLPTKSAAPGIEIVATCERPGSPERVGWAPAEPRYPGPGEIEIEIRAAGINFRDVLLATGALPEEALLDGLTGSALGLECAGIVRAVGAGVDTTVTGDRVMGFAPAALASRVITGADAVVAIPPGIDFAMAATVPVAFVTAWYSLVTLAQLQPGESVLIHAASGGVGLAAIQIAKSRGATVIAAAGSPAKRAFLRAVGADYVCDSRELRFVAVAQEATAGAGVDVVLNSQHGDAMEASLRLLKPFGRFIELGKRVFYENGRMQARPLRRNVSYFAVDVDRLVVARPQLVKSILGEIAAALDAGEIRPLAYRRFAFAEIADAFRLMQAAQHIGKLVLVPDGNAGIALRVPPTIRLSSDGVYVVTGGLSGFGFATARWLAERDGARHLALIGRRGAATPGVAERIAELEALGATVTVCAADVGNPDELTAALDDIRKTGLPIRGVVHAAAMIVDRTAATLSSGDIGANFHGKLGGAILLDQLTRQDPLGLFWLFSSATTLVGAPGQGAYVAANLAIEALARRRHAEGRPALAVAWGPIADAGHLAVQPGARDALSRRLGVRPLPAAQALSALPTIVGSGLSVVALADISWGAADHRLPIFATPLFDDFRCSSADAVAGDTRLDRLVELDHAERRDLIGTIVADEAARILRFPSGALDPKRPLADLGMDSLTAIELRLALETRLRLDMPLLNLADGITITALAVRIDQALQSPARAQAALDLASRYETPLTPLSLGGLDAAAEE
jgi:phthiocerol/phenolphthiocerol synthesis type-I polyketide synthase C